MADERITETRESTGTGRPPGSGEQKEWARREAEHLREELQSRGESLFNDQKASIAGILDGIARALDKSAPNFDQEGQPNTARYARLAADNLQRLSGDLRERDLESIRRQVSELGRKQPALLAGGAVALGFVASRFFRSSAEHSREQYPGEQKTPKSEEDLIIGTESGFRTGEAASSHTGKSGASSPILTEKEAREMEKEFPT